MSDQHVMDCLKQSKIFIWQGDWKGGAETVTLEIAKFLRDSYQITPTLGVFKGNKNPNQPFPQIEIETPFPKHLVAYNNLFASFRLRKQLNSFDLIITHTGGFWKTKYNHFSYREPGNLFGLFSSLPPKSKIGYILPLLFSIYGLYTSDISIAASKKAEGFFRKIHVRPAILSTNFIDKTKIPSAKVHTYNNNTERFNLTFIGRDDKIKNLAWLEKTCTKLSDTLNIHLHVFGIKKQNTKCITYHGWVDEEIVWDFLQQQTHIFVLPSLFEASPLVLLQALACGTPCLVKSSALPDELIPFTSSFRDPYTFKKSLTAFMKDYDAYAKTAHANASTIRNHYDKQTVLTKEFSTIAKAISEAHPQLPKK